MVDDTRSCEPMAERRRMTKATRRWLLIAALAVVCLLLSASPALADDAFAKPRSPVALEHLKMGNRLYRVREFDKAIEEYKAGALREDVPVFHYNLAQCYRQLGRHEEALWHYERFLQRGQPTGELEQATKDFIEQMKGELQKKKAMSQPPPKPDPDPQLAAARPHTPEAQPAARVQAERVSRDGMAPRRKLAIAVGTGGIAMVGLGIGLGLRGRRLIGEAADICPMDVCTRADEANVLVERGNTNSLYANIAFGAGAAAVASAAVLWFTGSARKHRGTAVVPQVSRGFAGFAASRQF